MPLNPTGPISLAGSTAGQSIAVQLGVSPTGPIGLADANVRALAEVLSGPITMPGDFWGKPAGFAFSPTVSGSTNNYNLKSAAIAAGWDQVTPLIATITIGPGVVVGSTSTATPAFDTGATFPAGTTISVINNGFIVGRGGNGATGAGSGGGGGAGNGLGGGAGVSGIGNPGSNGTNTTGGAGGATRSIGNPGGDTGFARGGDGTAGGPALQAQTPITLTNNGTIGGGGGGGGAGGYVRLASASITSYAGGAGGNLGNAGGSGVGAGPAPGGTGGAAGAAIIGNSNIIYAATGTILGSIT